MKNLFNLSLIIFIFAITFISCSQSSNDNETSATETNSKYKGTIIVSDSINEPFRGENIETEIVLNEQQKVLDLKIYKVKFASNMPIKIDMTLKNIPYETTSKGIDFKSDSIVPYIGEIAFPTYMFKWIKASTIENVFRFDGQMSIYVVNYEGTKAE